MRARLVGSIHGKGYAMKKLLVLLALCATGAFAQGNTAQMNGQITDPTGAAVPGAEVTVTNLATDQVFKASTNEHGEWALSSMGAAKYKIVISKPGFKVGVVPEVEMNAGVPATVNFKLEVGAATETVEVAAGAELLQTTSA